MTDINKSAIEPTLQDTNQDIEISTLEENNDIEISMLDESDDIEISMLEESKDIEISTIEENNDLEFEMQDNTQDIEVELPAPSMVDFTAELNSKGDNLEYDAEENKLYLTSKGTRISEGITVSSQPGGESEDIDLSAYQTREDENLETKSKEIVGAINELAKLEPKCAGLTNEINNLNSIVLGNTWLLNKTFSNELFDSGLEYEFDFTSNGKHFTKMKYYIRTSDNGMTTRLLYYYDADGNTTRVYTTAKTDCWEDEAYRTIVTDEDISLNLIALRIANEPLKTEARTVVGAVNEVVGAVNKVGDKVETNEADIKQLKTLPPIIFKDPSDVVKLAQRLGLGVDDATIVDAINQLATQVDGLSANDSEYEEDRDALCIPFEVNVNILKVIGIDIPVKFGALYINFEKLKIYARILHWRVDITDWEQVQWLINWVETAGEAVVAWVTETGEIVYKWITETGEVVYKWFVDTGEAAVRWVNDVGKEAARIGTEAGQWIYNTGAVAVKWVNEVGKEIEGWIISVGEIIKGIIITLCDYFPWLGNPFAVQESPEEAAAAVGEAIAGAIETQKKVVSPAWKLSDKFANTDIFEYEFDFTSNGRVFNKMRSKINTNEYGQKTYLIHYIYYENGAEKFVTVYSSAKSGGWMAPEYQTVYASNPTSGSTAILTNIAGTSWKLNEKLKSNYKASFKLKCDFIANNVTYKEIRVNRAEGIYAPDHFMYQFDRDKIEFCTNYDETLEGKIVYYYHPQEKTGGWLDSVTGEYNNPQSIFRDIIVLSPTDHINNQLLKIGTEVTEKLDTTSQTVSGGINELFHNIGNLGDLEIEEVSKYSMRRSVEDEEEAPEQETLVKAINKVYRRTVAMQETIDELDAKIIEQLNGNVWVLHQDISNIISDSFTYNFKFTSNGRNFNKIHCDYWESTGAEPNEYSLWYCAADGTEENVCYFNGYRADWYGEEYRTIITTDDISLEHIATLEKKEDDAPTLVAGNNIQVVLDEEANTVEVKLADSITLKGNYPLALTRDTDEYKGYCYINPPALKSGTIDLYIPPKSGTLALVEDLAGFGDRKDGLSTYLYNGVFDTTSLSWFEPEATTTIDMSDINIPTGRTLQVGDLLIDTVGTVAYVHYIYLNTVEYVVKMSLGGGSGSSKAIIDVTELPTENINEEAFYRLPVGTFFYEDYKNNWACIVVDTLPEDALPVTTDMVNVTLYYDMSSGNAQGYANDMISGAFGIPVGWYPMEVVCQLTGNTWNGIVFNESDVPQEYDGQNRITLLIETNVYQYKNRWTKVNSSVGLVGTGFGAEVFNSKRNIASGEYSHAEGYRTDARGESSHAEGDNTTAGGMGSHSEGNMTGAYGNYSHAEGEETLAHGYCQHVQGKRNIEDTENKYAHIVGNGENLQNRSNAHTIDWQGNGWFAGTIKVGGTGQDDEEAKELATKEYVDSKIGGSADDNSTIGTWVFNEVPSFDSVVYGVPYSFNFTSLGIEETLVSIVFENSKYGASGNFLTYDFINNDGSGGSYTAYSSVPVVWLKGGWDNESYRTITIQDELEDGWFKTWLKANAKKQTETSKPCLEMPQIRFTSANGNAQENSTFYVDEENPLKLTVEITGGGALQVGDQLQACIRKRFNGSRANGFKRKYKLQRFAEYVVTEEDLDKKYLTVSVNFGGATTKPYRGLFRDGDIEATGFSPLYLRIRRPKGGMQNNDSEQTVDATFSNIVTVWKSHHRSNQAIRIY